MLIISDVSFIVFLHGMNFKMKNSCDPQPSEKVFKQTTIETASFYSINTICCQLSYWLLACKCWELSYRFDELIRPFTFDQRPKWHKWFQHSLTAGIFVIDLVTCLVTIAAELDDNHNIKDRTFMVVFCLNLCLYFIILAVLGRSILRIK